MKTTSKVLSGIALAATLMVLTTSNAKADDRDYGRGDRGNRWSDRDYHRGDYRHYEAPRVHRSFWDFGFIFNFRPPVLHYAPPPPHHRLSGSRNEAMRVIASSCS